MNFKRHLGFEVLHCFYKKIILEFGFLYFHVFPHTPNDFSKNLKPQAQEGEEYDLGVGHSIIKFWRLFSDLMTNHKLYKYLLTYFFSLRVTLHKRKKIINIFISSFEVAQ